MTQKKHSSCQLLIIAIFLSFCSPFLRADVEEQAAQIQSVSISQKANGTIIRITTDGKPPNDVTAWEAANGWFYITLIGCRIDTTIENPFIETGIVTDFQSLQLEESVQLSFRLSEKPSAFNILDNSKDEILITMRLPVGETLAIVESGNLLEVQPAKPNPMSYLVMATGGGLIIKGVADSRTIDFLAGAAVLVGGYLWMKSSPTPESDKDKSGP